MRASVTVLLLSFLLGSGIASLAAADGVSCLAHWQPAACRAVDLTGDLAVLGAGERVQIVDLATPPHGDLVSELALGEEARDVAVSGQHVFVVLESGLRVLDLADPGQPVEIAQVAAAGVGGGHAVAVAGDRLYFADGYRLRILDVTDPTAPVQLGQSASLGLVARDIVVAGDLVYAAVSDPCLSIVDVSDPAAPVEIGSFDVPGQWVDDPYGGHWDPLDYTTGVAVAGDRAYVLTDAAAVGLYVVDIADPATPLEIENRPGLAGDGQLAMRDGLLFVAAEDNGLRVLDPAGDLVQVDAYHGAGEVDEVAWLGDDLLVGAWDVHGIRVLAWRPDGVLAPVAWLDLHGVTDLALVGDLLYVTRGWGDGALTVVDLGDPLQPFVRGSAPLPGQPASVAVRDGLAYVTAWDQGLRVVDVTDPDAPVEVAFLDAPAEAGAIALGGDVAYVSDGIAGLVVIWIDYLDYLEVARQYATADEPAGLCVDGDRLHVADRTAGFRIYDRSSVPELTLLGQADTPGRAVDVATAGDRLYVADDTGGLRVFDVSDAAAPELVGFFADDPEERFAAVTIRGDWLACSLGEGGLRILREDGLSATPPLPAASLRLEPPRPNPFNPRVTIAFELAGEEQVELAVHDLRGRLITVLTAGVRPAGRHAVIWDGCDDDGRAMPSGAYLVTLSGDGGSSSRKIALVR